MDMISCCEGDVIRIDGEFHGMRSSSSSNTRFVTLMLSSCDRCELLVGVEVSIGVLLVGVDKLYHSPGVPSSYGFLGHCR